MEESEYDKVTQASMNSLYVKAQELDRDHNTQDAPATPPPGALGDAQIHASTHASDADNISDAQTHASTHASDAPDAESHATSHASDAESHATDTETHRPGDCA